MNATRSVEEDKAPEETLTLKELDNQEVLEEFDYFPFSGSSSCDPVLKVEGQKPAKIWKGEGVALLQELGSSVPAGHLCWLVLNMVLLLTRA